MTAEDLAVMLATGGELASPGQPLMTKGEMLQSFGSREPAVRYAYVLRAKRLLRVWGAR